MARQAHTEIMLVSALAILLGSTAVGSLFLSFYRADGESMPPSAVVSVLELGWQHPGTILDRASGGPGLSGLLPGEPTSAEEEAAVRRLLGGKAALIVCLFALLGGGIVGFGVLFLFPWARLVSRERLFRWVVRASKVSALLLMMLAVFAGLEVLHLAVLLGTTSGTPFEFFSVAGWSFYLALVAIGTGFCVLMLLFALSADAL